ncbi:MAG: P-loop NTPase fold protein [Candidatus Sedimenticola sp. PURPLELP]
MKLKAPQISIAPEDPFGEDTLERKESAEILAELLSSLTESSVLSINGTWGSGKTTFIKMWQAYLVQQGFPCIYFNAWANDFTEDATAALIAELGLGIDELDIKEDTRKEVKEIYEGARKLSGLLLRRAIPTALKIATYGMVDLEQKTEEELADLVSNISSEQIDQYEQSKNTLVTFRESLEAMVSKICGEQQLIIFIDELDRCRPDFAISILEKAKHFFSISNIIFVFAVDKEQLGHSIRSIYGQGMDADGYLRRFIDFEYRLPLPDPVKYTKYLFNRFGFDEYFRNRVTRYAQYEPDEIIETFAALSKSFGLSLRTMEQCFSTLSIVLRTTPPNIGLHPILLTTLIILNASDSSLYENYINRQISAKVVRDRIKKTSEGKEFFLTNYGIALDAFIEAGNCDYKELLALRENYKVQLNKPGISDDQEESIALKMQVIDDIMRSRRGNISKYLSDKINISHRFVRSEDSAKDS